MVSGTSRSELYLRAVLAGEIAERADGVCPDHGDTSANRECVLFTPSQTNQLQHIVGAP
jgi:hypothetical protein